MLMLLIQQLNVLLYNTLNSSLTYYIEIRQALANRISVTLVCQMTKIYNIL